MGLRKEISQLDYQKSKTDNAELAFNYKYYDDWLSESIKASKLDGLGSKNWENVFVQFIDYLANPSITMKNNGIISSFVDAWLP